MNALSPQHGVARKRGWWFGVVSCGLALAASLGSGALSRAGDYQSAVEPHRLALVVGNGAYRQFAPLPGSITDAERVRDLLRDSLGFDVDFVTDTRVLDEFVDNHLAPFAAKIREGDLVVFYFSGHGFAYGQGNYLAPTLAPKTVRADQVDQAFLPEEAVRQFILDRHPGALLIFLDACRTYSGLVTNTAPFYTPEAPAAPDMAPMDPAPGPVQEGLQAPIGLGQDVLISFAAELGKPAIGMPAGQTSLYTTALLEKLALENQDLDQIRSEILYAVRSKTDPPQSPWFSGSFVPKVYLKPTASMREAMLASWQATLASGRREMIEKYLAFNTVGPYGDAARRWLRDNPRDIRVTYTAVSPLLPELSWESAGSAPVSFARFPDWLAVPRSLDLSEAQDVPVSLEAARPENLLEVQKQAFTTRALRGATDAGSRMLPRGAPLTIESGAPGALQAFAKTRSDDEPFAVTLPEVRSASRINVGAPLAEFSLSRGDADLATVVGTGPLLEGLEKLKGEGKTVGWASISTPRAAETRDQDLLSLRALYVQRALLAAGVAEAKISTLEGFGDGPEVVRVRLFGY